MRTRFFLINTASAATLQIITLISGFIIPKIILLVYGSEVNGLVSSISQFVLYFSLVEAGLAASIIYSLYKPIAVKDTDAINRILVAARIFYTKAGIVFTSLVTVMAIIYPLFIKVESLDNYEVFLLIFLISSSGILDFFTLSKYRVLLMADQHAFVISLANICSTSINVGLVYVCARLGFRIVLLRFVAVFSILVRSIILWLYCKKHYSYMDFSVNADLRALEKRWDAFYLQILGAVQRGSPLIIATIFTSLLWVSVYSVYNIVFTGIASIFGIFTTGLSSSFGDVIAKKEIKILQAAVQEFESAYYIIISIVYSSTFLLIDPFIKLYTADIVDFNYIYPTLSVLFILNGLLQNLKVPQGMLVIASGMYYETRLQTTIQALIALIGSVLGGWLFGLWGILFGQIASNIYRSLDLLFFIPRTLTKLSIFNTVKRWLMVAVSMMSMYFIKGLNIFVIKSYLGWVVNAILIVIISSVITILLFFFIDSKQLKNIWNRLKRLRCVLEKE